MALSDKLPGGSASRAVISGFVFVCRQLYNTCEGLLVLNPYGLHRCVANAWSEVRTPDLCNIGFFDWNLVNQTETCISIYPALSIGLILVIGIYQTSEYQFSRALIGYSRQARDILHYSLVCKTQWTRAREITFSAEFWPDELLLFLFCFVIGYSLVWYILTQLLTEVEVNSGGHVPRLFEAQ